MPNPALFVNSLFVKKSAVRVAGARARHTDTKPGDRFRDVHVTERTDR